MRVVLGVGWSVWEQVVVGVENCGGRGGLFQSGREGLCGRSGDGLSGRGLCGLGE